MMFRKRVDQFLASCLVVIMGAMVINVLWQVFSRFILNNPSSFTDELARYLMIWLGVLGAAYVSGRNMHVAIDVIPSKLNPKLQKFLLNWVYIIIIAFSLTAMVIGGSRLVYITLILKQSSPALQIPLAWVYAIIPISGLFVIYYKMSDLLKKNK